MMQFMSDGTLHPVISVINQLSFVKGMFGNLQILETVGQTLVLFLTLLLTPDFGSCLEQCLGTPMVFIECLKGFL